MAKDCPKCGRIGGNPSVCPSCGLSLAMMGHYTPGRAGPPDTPARKAAAARDAEAKKERRREANRRLQHEALEWYLTHQRELKLAEEQRLRELKRAQAAEMQRLRKLKNRDLPTYKAFLDEHHALALEEWQVRWVEEVRTHSRMRGRPGEHIQRWEHTISWNPDGWRVLAPHFVASLAENYEERRQDLERQRRWHYRMSDADSIESRIQTWQFAFSEGDDAWRIAFPSWVPAYESWQAQLRDLEVRRSVRASLLALRTTKGVVFSGCMETVGGLALLVAFGVPMLAPFLILPMIILLALYPKLGSRGQSSAPIYHCSRCGEAQNSRYGRHCNACECTFSGIEQLDFSSEKRMRKRVSELLAQRERYTLTQEAHRGQSK